MRSVAPSSSNVLSLVPPKETQMGSGFAVCRFGHEAVDAHILSDHGSVLLLSFVTVSMDRNYLTGVERSGSVGPKMTNPVSLL